MPKDPPKKSKGVFASDDQRATIGRSYTPPAIEASGEIEVPDRDDDRERERDRERRRYQVEADEPTPRPHSIQATVDKLWEDTREDVHDLKDDREKVWKRLTAIAGEDGDNGKVGVLQTRVDGLTSKAWWVISTALGGLVAAAVKLIIVVRAFDAVEAKAEHNAQQITLLQAQALQLQAQVQTLQAALNARYRNQLDQPDRMTP